jgi:hypothetical protein
MAAKHKNQNSTFRATTVLAPDEVAKIAQQCGEKVKNTIPGQPFVRFEGAQPGRLNFSIRSLGGHSELMTFHAEVSATDGTTAVRTHIDRFKTTQQTFMFIPVSPKSLLGYSQYKRFASAFLADLKAADRSTTGELVERPNG